MVRLLAETEHLLGQLCAAVAAFSPYLGKRHVNAQLPAFFRNERKLCLRIEWEAVNRYYAGQSEYFRDILHMLKQVRKSLLQSLQILVVQICLSHASVML